ncbi:MAG: M55 family metallopeptidase, partial [Candidatus Aminicenantes bacterium]|nr:M55 family metallopeptidase [Candidatus Aminicenantes bacterium]
VFARCAVITSLAAGQKPGPTVFISVDMEGIWGVVHGDQTSPASPEYGPARRWMVDDVNAVIAGLFEAGASEVVVNDSHGSMRNIIADGLDQRASLVSGSPKPLLMMQGIDGTFDACIFVGYHAKAGTASAILDHTISGSAIRSIKINGQELPELGINGAIAGYFKVPVIMLSGDIETCVQARSILGNEIVTVAVKEGAGRYAAKLLPQEEARKRLREGAKEALLKKAKIMLFKLNPPYQFELDFNNSGQAELPSMIPGVKRTGARGVTFSSSDYMDGVKLMRALIALASAQ